MRRLVEQIKSPVSVIPFIGAGMSIPLGFPGWTSFLLSQAKLAGVTGQVQSKLRQNDYEAAAELILNALTSFALHAAIEQNFGDHRIRITGESVPEALKYLIQLTSGPVFTTNFDRVLERAYEARGRPFKQIIHGARPDETNRALHQNHLKLIKLHGDWAERSEQILTLSDYQLHYGYRDGNTIDLSLPLPRLLKQILTGRSLLFIGCSLNSDRTVEVLHQAAIEAPGITHFAIVEEPRVKKQRLGKARHLAEHNILPFWYPFGRHELIERILSSLVSRTIESEETSKTGSNGERVDPFDYGRPVSAHRFVGRHEQFRVIRNKFGADTSQCLSIIGFRRSGKSSILKYIRERPLEFCEPDQHPIILLLDLQDNRFETPTGLLEGLRREITTATGKIPWSDQNEPFEVGDGLARLVAEDYRLIILLDEFESIKKRIDLFERWGADWRAKVNAGLFVLGICSQRPLAETYTSWGLTSPFANVFTETTLGSFTDSEWRKLVTERFSMTGNSVSDSDLALIYELAGGLPYFTQMAASILWQRSSHELTQDLFRVQAFPRFFEIWGTLNSREQHALRYAAEVPNLAAPSQSTITSLTSHGLLRSDGTLFSSTFREFVRTQE